MRRAVALHAQKSASLSCQLTAFKLTAQESSLFALKDFPNAIALFVAPNRLTGTI
jgi:hypothetical protein